MSGPINPNCYSKGARFNARKSTTDNYETPAWAVEALVKALDTKLNYSLKDMRTMADPCCGRGVICAEVNRLAPHLQIQASDIRPVPRQIFVPNTTYSQRDLFKTDGHMENRKPIDIAIINPPFTMADEMVLHLIHSEIPIICVLQRTQYMEGNKRYEALFRDWPETSVYHFVNRVSMEVEGKARLVASGMMTFSWFIWDMRTPGQRVGTPTTLHRLTDKPYFEHDRRLAAVVDGLEIEVRDLFDYDLDKFMLYRYPCAKCGSEIMEKPKGKNTLFCGACSWEHERPEGKQERAKFELDYRIG